MMECNGENRRRVVLIGTNSWSNSETPYTILEASVPSRDIPGILSQGSRGKYVGNPGNIVWLFCLNFGLKILSLCISAIDTFWKKKPNLALSRKICTMAPKLDSTPKNHPRTVNKSPVHQYFNKSHWDPLLFGIENMYTFCSWNCDCRPKQVTIF